MRPICASALPGGEDDLPRLDLILLGLGADGHTASLFPGMPALAETRRLVVHTPVPSYVNPQIARVTLTYPALNAAAHVLFLVTGAGKSETVQRVLSGQDAADPLPAARLQLHHGRLFWLLDAEASATSASLRTGPG